MIKFLRRYVFHNAGLKLLSLLIAVLLWVAVAHEPMTEVALTVPIEFHHVPDALELSTENIPPVQVRVRGPARTVRNLDQAEVHAIVDLAGAHVGEITYDLRPSQIRVPLSVEVVQVVPTQVRLDFDKQLWRQVEVKPRVIGTFASGVHLAQIISDPRQVAIVGPQGHVMSVESAMTDPVDASGVVGRATFTTHVYVPDPLVRTQQSQVRVTVITTASDDDKEPGASNPLP
jgi:YbbR domain-containing protein